MQREQSECTAAIQFARQHGIRQHMMDAILLIRYIVISPFTVVVWIRWVYDTPIYLLCQYVYRNSLCFLLLWPESQCRTKYICVICCIVSNLLAVYSAARDILLFLYRIQTLRLHFPTWKITIVCYNISVTLSQYLSAAYRVTHFRYAQSPE